VKFRLDNGLPFLGVRLTWQGRALELDNCLLDTGSARCLFAADRLAAIGIKLDPADPIHRVFGVGGAEFVFTKRLDALEIDGMRVDAMEIEVGAMDYGFPFDGILGVDFLLRVGAVIDMKAQEIRRTT
jgi:hypothetical protein